MEAGGEKRIGVEFKLSMEIFRLSRRSFEGVSFDSYNLLELFFGFGWGERLL